MILAAAGASDRRARADLHTTRTLVSELTGSWVDMGFAGTGGPDVRTAVQRPETGPKPTEVRAASWSPPSCWQKAFFKSGCGHPVPMW